MLSEEELIKIIRILIKDLIDRIFLDPDFRACIDEISIKKKHSIRYNTYHKSIIIKIITNNRPLFLGQFLYFPINGLSGFHPGFFNGFIRGYFHGKYDTDILDNYEIFFDVYPTEPSLSKPDKFIKIEEALKYNLIDNNSTMYKIMKKHNLKYLLITGSNISGPSISMIKYLKTVCNNYKINTVLDIFSGTGSLSKIALDFGAKKVTCLDSNINKIKENISNDHDKCKIIKEDAFSYSIKGKYDLILMDPYYSYSYDVAKMIIPKCYDKCKILLINLGNVEDNYWINKIYEVLLKYFKNIKINKDYESAVALCSNAKEKV